jgi:hypothetical protein
VTSVACFTVGQVLAGPEVRDLRVFAGRLNICVHLGEDASAMSFTAFDVGYLWSLLSLVHSLCERSTRISLPSRISVT